jgi:sulfur-oxidizing protein SoxB
VSEETKDAGGEPIWDVCARHLRATKIVNVKTPNVPVIEGMRGNP